MTEETTINSETIERVCMTCEKAFREDYLGRINRYEIPKDKPLSHGYCDPVCMHKGFYEAGATADMLQEMWEQDGVKEYYHKQL